MIRAIYPGSFDPVTFGHMDIIQRSAKLVDELIVGVLNNRAKSPSFTIEERVEMLREVTSGIPNVEITAFQGLSVDFARDCKANVMVRGLRAVTDFDYELQLAQTNKIMCPQVDTMFLTTSLEYAYLSSTTMKEVAYFGGDLSKFAPKEITDAVMEKIHSGKNQTQK